VIGRIGKRLLASGALFALLTACAMPDEGGERFVDMPDDWETVDLAEADLTLPLTLPFEIRHLGKRIGEGQIFENLYSFNGVKGFVLTSRVFFGHYSENTMLQLRRSATFHSFAEDLPEVQRRSLKVGKVFGFSNQDPNTVGHYTVAVSEPRHESCFIARVGYRLVDYNAVARAPGDIDTIVVVQLCDDRLDEETLVDLLRGVEAVEDREAFRQALSRRAVGTI
jgi:hypothetical protein